MATYYNIRTGETLTQEDFSARICDVDYTCCSQFENVWISGNVAKNEYQWQVYFIENNLCSDGNAPVNTVLPSISGVLIVGQTLTRVAGTWTADLPITTTWVWKSNGTTVQTGGATYVVQASDAGKTIVITETASDDDGSANASSVGSVILATLLDITGNAKGAYSSYLLRGAYYGSPLVRVRRSGDSAEFDFGVTTSGVLDTSAIVAFCVAGGGAQNGTLVKVYDQTGQGNDLTQTTPSDQLSIVTSGVIFGTTAQIARQSGGYLGFNATIAHQFDITGGTKMFLTGAGVSLSPNTLTGSSATSALSISQTWNTTGNPSLIFANVTNTASGASANLIDLQIGGSTIFKVDKYATLTCGAANTAIIHNGTFSLQTAGIQHFRSNSSGTNIGTGGLVASAISVESTTQGFLPPRMTTAQKNAIASPAAGLMVYDTTLNQMSYYNGTAWVNF
jgi:hypothetical protein